MEPIKSVKLMKLFLSKSQLPYEMVFILGKCMQMVAIELAEYYNKQPNQIDAETMVPYIMLVVILAVKEVNTEMRHDLESALKLQPEEKEVLDDNKDDLIVLH